LVAVWAFDYIGVPETSDPTMSATMTTSIPMTNSLRMAVLRWLTPTLLGVEEPVFGVEEPVSGSCQRKDLGRV
jgi:hypothetical protein